MRKLTLLAAMAACAMGASAQGFVGDPSLDATMSKGEIYDLFLLDEASTTKLQQSGKTVHNYKIDEVERHWYVWDNTFIGVEPSYPGVDMQMEGYQNMTVGTVGWSGAGLTVDAQKPIDLKHITDDTRFHMGLRSDNPATAICVIFGDGQNDVDGVKWSPAKLSVGSAAFNDGGVIYPLIGDFDRTGGDRVAIDMSLGDMKKIYPAFNYKACDFSGNIYSILGGGVAGTAISIDAVYLYSPKTGAVEGIEGNNAQIVVSNKTISVVGGENGIELYNIAGQLVKATENGIMGTEDVNGGVYIVKAGIVVEKVVLY